MFKNSIHTVALFFILFLILYHCHLLATVDLLHCAITQKLSRRHAGDQEHINLEPVGQV